MIIVKSCKYLVKMSLIMDEFSKPSGSAYEEIRKLQDLVKKLETQNMHLRNKQNIGTRRNSTSPTKEKSSSNCSSPSHLEKEADEKISICSNVSIQNSQHSLTGDYFDDLEIIKVSDIEMSDDESWLYTSPKSLAKQQKNESPYKWLRKDIDDPENKELQLTKKALLTKLNELEILSTPSQVNSFTHYTENFTSSSVRSPRVPLAKTPLYTQSHGYGHIDSRTFTRSRKKQAIEYLETMEGFENKRNNIDKVSSSTYEVHRRDSDLSMDSIGSCHALEDANDVQEVARMQEESLRLSSPVGTPKRFSLSRKISIASRSSVSDQDTSENAVFSDQFDESAFEQNANSLTHNDSLNFSDHSSPSESPSASNVALHNVGKGKAVGKLTGYRSSLPNLNRDTTTFRQSQTVISEEKVRKNNATPGSSRARKSDSSLQVLQKSRREFASPTRLRQSPNPKTSRSVYIESTPPSEQPTTVPRSAEGRLQVRSGLPRPARASSATRLPLRQSGIPMPSSLTKKRVEDSWSEGCF